MPALTVAAALAIVPAFAHSATVAAEDPLPVIEADSLSGRHVVLPADSRDQPFVVIFEFSQKAGEASAKWSHVLYKALPPSIAIYAVADLSRVPRIFRGSRANDWAHVVPTGSDDDAVVVAVDKSGIVTDIERRAFSAAAADDIVKTLARRP